MSAVAGLLVGGGGSSLEVVVDDGSFANGYSPARFALSSDGNQYVNDQVFGAWLFSGQASQAECYAEIVEGSLRSGLTNSWVPLSTTRSWDTSGRLTLNISIRQVGSSVILDTAQIELATFYGRDFQ